MKIHKKILFFISFFILSIKTPYLFSASYLGEDLLESIQKETQESFSDATITEPQLELKTFGLFYSFGSSHLSDYILCTFCKDKNCESIKAFETSCLINPKYYENASLTLDLCREPQNEESLENSTPVCTRVLTGFPIAVSTLDLSEEIRGELEELYAKKDGLTQLGSEASTLFYLSHLEESCKEEADFNTLRSDILSYLSPEMSSKLFEFLGYPFSLELEKKLEEELTENTEALYGSCQESSSSSFSLAQEGGWFSGVTSFVKKTTSAAKGVVKGGLERVATTGKIVGAMGSLGLEVTKVLKNDAMLHVRGAQAGLAASGAQGGDSPTSLLGKIRGARDGLKSLNSSLVSAQDKLLEFKIAFNSIAELKKGSSYQSLIATREFQELSQYFSDTTKIKKNPTNFFAALDDFLDTEEYQTFKKQDSLKNLTDNFSKALGLDLDVSSLERFQRTPEFIHILASTFESTDKAYTEVMQNYRGIQETIAEVSSDVESMRLNFKDLDFFDSLGVDRAMEELSVKESKILQDSTDPKFKKTVEKLYESWRAQFPPEFNPEDSFKEGDEALKKFFPESSSLLLEDSESKLRRAFDLAFLRQTKGLDPSKYSYQDFLSFQKGFISLQESRRSSFQKLFNSGSEVFLRYEDKLTLLAKNAQAKADLITHLAKNFSLESFQKIERLKNDLETSPQNWEKNFRAFETEVLGFLDRYTNENFLLRASVLYHNLGELDSLSIEDKSILKDQNHPKFPETVEKALNLKKQITGQDLKLLTPAGLNNFLSQHIKNIGQFRSSDFVLDILKKSQVLVGDATKNIKDLTRTILNFYKSSLKWSSFANAVNTKLKSSSSRLSSDSIWDFFAKDTSLQKKLISSEIQNVVKTFSKKEAAGLIDALFPSETFSDSDKRFFSSFLSSYSSNFVGGEGVTNKLQIPVWYASGRGSDQVTKRVIEVEIKDPVHFASDPEKVRLLTELIESGPKKVSDVSMLERSSSIQKNLTALQEKLGVPTQKLKDLQVGKQKISFDSYRVKFGLQESEVKDLRLKEEKLFSWNSLALVAFSQDQLELGMLFLAQILKEELSALENSSCTNQKNLFTALSEIEKKEKEIYQMR